MASGCPSPLSLNVITVLPVARNPELGLGRVVVETWVCAPTPGTSTGESKVITVLLFQSSALALERAVTATRHRQKIIAPTLVRSILIIRFTSILSWGRSILPHGSWFGIAFEMN